MLLMDAGLRKTLPTVGLFCISVLHDSSQSTTSYYEQGHGSPLLPQDHASGDAFSLVVRDFAILPLCSDVTGFLPMDAWCSPPEREGW